MNTDEISNQLSEIGKKILEHSRNLDTVQKKQFELKKELMDINESVRQGKHILSDLRTQEKNLEREYWRVRKGF